MKNSGCTGITRQQEKEEREKVMKTQVSIQTLRSRRAHKLTGVQTSKSQNKADMHKYD